MFWQLHHVLEKHTVWGIYTLFCWTFLTAEGPERSLEGNSQDLAAPLVVPTERD